MKPYRWLRREPLRGGTCPDPAPAGARRPCCAPLLVLLPDADLWILQAN